MAVPLIILQPRWDFTVDRVGEQDVAGELIDETLEKSGVSFFWLVGSVAGLFRECPAHDDSRSASDETSLL